MEIETGIKYLLSSLTFDESNLAQALIKSEQYRQKSATVWLRAPVIELVRDIAYVRDQARSKGFLVRDFRFYCDTLIIGEGSNISPTSGDAENRFTMRVFARKVEVRGTLSVRMTENSELSFYTPDIASALKQIQFTLPNGTTKPYQVVMPANKVGLTFTIEDKDLDVLPEGPPGAGLENINYLSLINENGTVQDQDFLNDDYPRLIQLQLLVAQANASINRGLAIDLLKYIVAMTNNAYGGYFNLQANGFLGKLMISDDVVSIPSVNIYSSKTVLKSRLTAALAFEQAFHSYQTNAGNLQIQTINALNMMAKNRDVQQVFAFQRSLKERNFTNATKANDEATKALEESKAKLERLGNDFQDGIDEWVKKKKQEAAKSIIGSLFGAMLAIGATVLSGGLAAPLAGVSIGALANSASSIATLVKTLKEFYEKVKELIEKLKPIIDKIKEMVKTVQEVIKSLKEYESGKEGLRTTKPNIEGKEPINAIAEYDRFSIQVAELESNMTQFNDIRGKSDYFIALKIMVVNGKAAIQAQTALVQAGDELATITIQQQMEARDEKRLTIAANAISSSKAVAEIFTRAMFDRVLAIRTRIYMDFSDFLTAYRYHSLSDESLLSLSPVKPVGDYLQDMTTLQGAVASYGSRVLVQKRTFSFDSLCGFDSTANLAATLSSGDQVPFMVSPTDPAWSSFWRIRTMRARCFLNGAKLLSSPDKTTSTSIRLELSTNGQFFDIDPYKTAPRAFVGDPRRILFEYEPNTKAIRCDGDYGQEQDYTKHTPMTTWQISIDTSGVGSAKPSEIDFSGLTGITMEFESLFSWKSRSV